MLFRKTQLLFSLNGRKHIVMCFLHDNYASSVYLHEALKSMKLHEVFLAETYQAPSHIKRSLLCS